MERRKVREREGKCKEISKSKSSKSKKLLLSLFYDWENHIIVIGWEQANLSLILNLDCSAN